MKMQVRRLIAFLLFVTSALTLAWGVWPLGGETRMTTIYPADMQLPADAETPGGAWSVPEGRTLVLEFPAVIRVGDTGIIGLVLEAGTEGPTMPTAGIPAGGTSANEAQFQDVYLTHFVVAEARLELAGMEYAPVGQISEGLLLGKPAAFGWRLRPRQTGESQGTVWLHLRYLPLGGGDEVRRVLSAQVIDIRAVSLFGLSGRAARVLGSVGVVVGAVLGLDELLPWLWKRYQARR